jgi:ABC-2 type transport system ATP-binding protein
MSTTPPSTGAPVISATAISKMFGPGAGVREFDLRVEPGTILGLIGPSGSGKTTTVRLLTGLLAPDEGELTVFDQDPARFTVDVRQRIGYLPQESALYPTLSIRENVSFAAGMYGLGGRTRSARVDAVLEMVDLADAGERRVADASGGMKRRAGLAAALVHEPDLAFLDEPTAGVDPILRHALWNEFGRLRDAGMTAVVTTQYVGDATMCDELALLADGTVVARGTPEDLRRDAYGGDLVHVRFDRSPGRTELERIAQGIDALSFRGTGLSEVEFTTRDAGSAIAEIHRAAEDSQLEVEEVDRRLPDMDDVFVRIVGRQREAEATTA